MSVDPALAAVRESVRVDATPDDAFAFFTTHIGEWWPLDKASYGGDRAKDMFLEPRVGGRFLERFVDGDELQVGSVVECDPPERIVFTWYTADWEGRDQGLRWPSEGTLVDLTHRGFERIGPLGPDATAKFRDGWPGVMAAFASHPNMAK